MLICSDVWRLNDNSLASCPSISIGGPGVNAFAAYLADKLDSAFVVDDILMVQLDLEYDDLVASCWGMDHESTIAAVEAFVEKYLEQFIEHVTSRIDA